MQRRFAGCVEVIRRPISRVQPKVAFFDFDGTIGLIRAGWMQLMIGQAMAELRATGTQETDAELLAVVEEFIFRLTGKPTIYQMIELAENVRKRGGVPIDPAENKNRFLAQLQNQSDRRIKSIRSGDVPPDKFMVPGSRAVLEDLQRRGLRLYLVSGTDDALVQEEARLFDIVRYFDGGVYGSPGDDSDFSKLGLAKDVVARGEATGPEIVSFGDGPVELEAVESVGGVAVGLATLEPECDRVDPWKRQRLISTGAHYIIPNYLCWNELKEQLLPSKYPQFDRSRLIVKPLSDRIHDLPLSRWLSLEEETPAFESPNLAVVASRLMRARETGTARILMMGAHVLRAGVNRHIIDLMSRGLIDHVAMNGAGAIHDYELARIGATTESVARYIRSGEFGLWRETGELNDLIQEAAAGGYGLGEWVGQHIAGSDFRYRELSVLAAAWRLNVPVTVHAGIGYDILHEHPNCDGAALGKASYQDFLIFASTVERLEGGVLLSFGSAIMAPEVYLKALAMSRNVAHQQGRQIRNFATAVFDLVPINGDIHKELPKTDPGYYFRPQKTILVRTVADGGESFYFCGDHRATMPALWRTLSR